MGYKSSEIKNIFQKSVDLVNEAIQELVSKREIKIVGSFGPYASYDSQASEYIGEYSSSDDEIINFHNNNLSVIEKTDFDIILYETIPCLREIEILSENISLDDLVSSYLLNSQLITVDNNEMMMLLPEEVQNHPNCMRWLDEIKSSSPIKHIEFVDIRQSMMNGGGPACLRFKAVVNNDEFDRLNEKFLLSPTKLMDLRALVSKHYRDQLNLEDLLDIKLMQESYTFLDELTQLLDLGALYNFQKN